MSTVLQTDFAWSDTSIERSVIEAAGHRFVAGPSTPLPPEAIEVLVAEHNPSAIMTCWADVSANAIARARDLRIVQRMGVGLDNIAVAAATARGAWVANVPDYCVEEVSAHTISLLLAWARGVAIFDSAVKKGRWDPAGAKLRRVSELTVGIIGYGRIGSTTARYLRALGCTVLFNSRTPSDEAGYTDLDTLLGASDAVILNVPLTSETEHMIDTDRIARMKDGAFLINVSRGPLVDNHALLAALVVGKLSGAGLDVIEGEPNPPRALVERDDVIVTPHVAFSSDASLAELRRRAAEEVVRVLTGDCPQNACNQPKQS